MQLTCMQVLPSGRENCCMWAFCGALIYLIMFLFGRKANCFSVVLQYGSNLCLKAHCQRKSNACLSRNVKWFCSPWQRSTVRTPGLWMKSWKWRRQSGLICSALNINFSFTFLTCSVLYKIEGKCAKETHKCKYMPYMLNR